MSRFRLFCLKNVMFAANSAATAVGAGLLYIIYEYVLRNHQTDQYVEFHLRTSNYLGAIFALCFALIIVYEWPIRRYFDKIGSHASIPVNLQTIVEKRLLNEPFFIIGIDYYDFIISDETKDRNIGAAIGDVSGHGIPAALLMATVRSSLRQRLSLPGSIDRVITGVNRQLVRDVEDTGQFMTLFYLDIDVANHQLKWVRAGHEPGIFYDPGSDTFEELKGPGIALGVMGGWQYEMNARIGLAPGQIIVLSTDGAWEAHNASGEIFGKERFAEVIRQHAAKKAEEIIEAVIAAVNQFQEEAGAEDDITIVAIKKEKRNDQDSYKKNRNGRQAGRSEAAGQ